MTIRITNGYMSRLLVGDLNRNLASMLDQQRMASTMQRVNSYADDPRAVASIQRYNSLLSQNSDYMSNTNRSRLLVDATDTALQDVTGILSLVRVIMLRESSAQATSGTMNNAALEVDSLMDQLMDLLNTSIDGNFIFAGTETDAPPFLRNAGTFIYQGNDEEIQSRVGPNSVLTVNLPGSELMGARSSTLAGTADLAPRLNAGTMLADLNLDEGWTPGAINIEDGSGSTWQVDLTGLLTVGDVLAEINTATGGAVAASISPDGTSFTLTGTGPLTVREDGGGTTATMLGLQGSSNAGTLIGRDVRPQADAMTLLSDIEALVGNLPLDSMEIDWQGTTYTVDFSGATTLGDLQTAVAATVPGMELHIRATGLSLVGGSPESFHTRNVVPTDTATLLGLAGMGVPVRLFGALEDLMTNLAAEDQAAVRDAASELEALEGVVLQMLMRNGNRQNNLDWSESVLVAREVRLRTNLSLELDVDVADVATSLSQAEMAYQASLAVTSRLFQMNLMQYL